MKKIKEIISKENVVILITAVAAITICSKSSPLYPFNDWGDSNCFMTVGKSMLHGMIPYKDLYEQKGPLLYMLHALTAMVSETTFIGVYFLEILAAAAFLFWGYKLVKLYRKSASVLIVPILAAVVYSANSFDYGDSAEELCLPFFAFAIYLMVRAVIKEIFPTWQEYLVVGITSASVLWIKYSMMGIYIGWFLVIAWLLIRNKNAKKILYVVFWVGVGVCIITIPILLYFGINHALADLWVAYFYNNLFLYTIGNDKTFLMALIRNLYEGIKNVLAHSTLSSALIGTGLVVMIKKEDKTEILSYLILGFFAFLLVYGGGRHYRYYAFIFNSFAPIGIPAVYEMVHYLFGERFKTSSVLSGFYRFTPYMICAGSLIFAFVMCNNTYMLRYDKSDLPQYRFAEIIAQKEDATLLNYGFLDEGFFTTAGIVPNCKYFCTLNIPLDEMIEVQNEYIQEGRVDYVVTKKKELEADRYQCIARTYYYREKSKCEYFLYQLIQ